MTTEAHGHLWVENAEIIETMDLTDCLFGFQIGDDGRVWVCINGTAWLRFKPHQGARTCRTGTSPTT